ncbi:sperm flagellar protein 1 isoform X2 [Oryzias melastigma]|uniref:Sperm flagellar 1 n=1 Tax=Oryzias melastigma TaxID=30732 RepID=A0A3B3B8G9_ORYME|nr:sperm flagellar protein 1 isoform X2 [Oryzias melastigma]
MERELNDEEQQDLFAWIDKIPLSRPKRNISRDFSDGVMAAEVVKHFFPKLVDLHNYIPANSTQQKLSNWNLLNRKVFSKLDFHVPEETLNKIILSSSGAVVSALSALREKIDNKLENPKNNIPNLDYYDTRNLQNACAEIHQAPTQLTELRKDERNVEKNMKLQHAVKFYPDMDPNLRLLLQEKEQAVMSLQETVEILQIKVNKLEHLVHLKDMRIEDLTRHLETYKAKARSLKEKPKELRQGELLGNCRNTQEIKIFTHRGGTTPSTQALW